MFRISFIKNNIIYIHHFILFTFNCTSCYLHTSQMIIKYTIHPLLLHTLILCNRCDKTTKLIRLNFGYLEIYIL